MANFFDVCIQPIKAKHLAQYKKGTLQIGKILIKHGALSSTDYVASDSVAKKITGRFGKASGCKKGEIIIIAFAEFKSKAHRDQVFKKMMKDADMQKFMQKSAPFMDHTRMITGGFQEIVKLSKT